MKRIIVAFSSMVFILFVGCGGDKEQAKKPPAPKLGQTQNQDDLLTQQAIAHWAQEAVDSCSQSACGFAQQTGPVLVASLASPVPLQLNQIQAIQAALNQPADQSQQGCVYALKQLKLNMDTAAGGTYSQRPDVQQWFENGVLRPIGTGGAQCLPQAYAVPGFIQQASQLGGLYATSIAQQVGGVPAWASSALSNGIGNCCNVPGY
jgi:hypothetical protein